MIAPAAAPRIVFGMNREATEHAFRHADRIGLPREEVMQAITQDLRPRLPLPTPRDNVPHKGSVMVQGSRLHDHAFPLENGVINVGRITPA